MDTLEYLQIVALAFALFVLGPALGRYMANVYEGKNHIGLRAFGWLERGVYRVIKINSKDEMTWRTYAGSLLTFNLIGLVVLFSILQLQGFLPANPDGREGVPFWLALNTAVSFVTNTNWQSYSGEATLSHFSQMAGLGVQNFASAATGMAVAVALARGLARKSTATIGNFWADLTRSVVYILIPLSFVFALIFVSQGVVQNFSEAVPVTTLAGSEQLIPGGPAASQIAIKQLGTNGGGFFGVNSAHPFENPTPLTNILQIMAIMLIPFATPFMFGRLIGNSRHGVALFTAMGVLFLAFLGIALWSEYIALSHYGLPAMEGKEHRFGVVSSVLWAVTTTATSNGSVNAMISSMSPLTGGVALLNIMLGEVVFGGVGSGLYGMVMFALLAVFIAGLMVGRTPEYLGKKIEAKEIKWAVLAVILPSALILAGSAIAASVEAGLGSRLNSGPHGLSEILYAFSSASGNNGSAFAGLNANTPFYNGVLALCMVLGRFVVIIPTLAIAGSLAAKKVAPPSPGTFPVEGGLFVALLVAVILIVGGLTFFPALSLGPIVEHLLVLNGRTY